MNIQWLKFIIFIIITMPGAFIYVMKKFPLFKYKRLGTIYLYILIIINILISLLFHKIFEMIFLILLMLGVVGPLICELNVWNLKKIYIKVIQNIGKNQSLFLFPILEEMHFRWLLFTVGQEISITPFAFVLISGLSFGIAHIPYLGVKSIYKVIQGLILATLFLNMGLTMVVLCHVLFNLFVYVYHSEKYEMRE